MFPQAERENLTKLGIINTKAIWWNLATPALYEQVLQRREGVLAHLGPLVTRTGNYTGRSPKDKFIVEEPSSMDMATRRLDLNSDGLTENTRASYPITHIPNISRDGMGGHPKNILFLTADAFGVLPPPLPG